jgi:hypothetical protein
VGRARTAREHRPARQTRGWPAGPHTLTAPRKCDYAPKQPPGKYPALMTADPETNALVDACTGLLEAIRMTLLTERLAARASLSSDEARDVRQEIETTHAVIEQIDAMLTLRRQPLRPM